MKSRSIEKRVYNENSINGWPGPPRMEKPCWIRISVISSNIKPISSHGVILSTELLQLGEKETRRINKHARENGIHMLHEPHNHMYIAWWLLKYYAPRYENIQSARVSEIVSQLNNKSTDTPRSPIIGQCP